MSASKEKVVLTPVDFEQGKSLLEQQEDPNQSIRCVKMESKIKVIIGFFVCATVIAISMGLAFGIDWSKSEEPPAPPPISGNFRYLKEMYTILAPIKVTLH